MTRHTESDNERIERERFFYGHGRGTIHAKPALTVGFKRLTPDATIPTKAHASDSGFDLCASADVVIEPGATVIVPTDIALDLPAGYEAVIRPRSGVTAKTKLRVAIGTIDNGFTGALGVIVDNMWQKDASHTLKYPIVTVNNEQIVDGRQFEFGTYLIRKGDRIAQLVIQHLPDVIGVEVFDVGESERGVGAFGSTGYK